MKQCLLLTVLLGLCACASGSPPRPSPLVPSEAVRAGLGRMGVRSGSATASSEWNLPAKGAGEGAKRGAIMGMQCRGQGCLLAPLGAAIGSIAGAATAESAEVVEQAEAVIKAAFTAVALQDALRDRVVEVARAETRHPVVPRADGAGTTATATRPEDPPGILDTALEIQVQRYGTKAARTPNPPVHLFFEAYVTPRRVADGSVVYTQRFTWVSPGRAITAWAVPDSEPVRHGLEGGIQALAERIVDVIFLVRSVP